jgi:HB1, ASXL, restriction endonuclease HTH domain
MEKSWRAAIVKVLTEAQMPMRSAEISELILSRSYYRTDGATPVATVHAQIASSIKHDAERSPFIRVGKGLFAVRPAPLNTEAETTGNDAENEESSGSIIHSFGMYWQRDLVVWRSDVKIFGKQQALSKPVDFGKQRGIYILYDHHTVVYVGRTIDRSIGKRLHEHTVDRLGSRWNRFSWFGLLDVTQEGSLRETPLNANLDNLVAIIESLLIEVLEPPQNRKRGDDFSAIEYIQDVDPELRERKIKETLRTIEEKMRSGG